MKKDLWITQNDRALSKENLMALFENRIAAIRIPNFATESDCNELVKSANRVGFDFYENVYPKIGRIGITQFELKDRKHEYFQNAPQAITKIQNITSNGFSPLNKLSELIRGKCGLESEIAKEEEKTYFAGLTRHINKALLHIDFGPFDGPDWENQITTIVEYLS